MVEAEKFSDHPRITLNDEIITKYMKIIQEKEDVTFLNNKYFGIFLEGRMNIMKNLPG
jgi:hypothetical protein